MKPSLQLGSLLVVLVLSGAALAQPPAEPARLPGQSGEWPQWRGPNRDGVSAETGLLREWPKEGPPVVWQVDSVGAGYSSLAVKDGRLFTQGDLNGVEHILCLDARTGRTLWAMQPEPAAQRLQEQVAKEMKRLDHDGDGTVDEIEALAGLGWSFTEHDEPLAEGQKDASAQRAGKVFESLDKDHDGKLSIEEGGEAFGEQFPRIDREESGADVAALAKERAEALVKWLDRNQDGSLSREETRQAPVGRWLRQIEGGGRNRDKEQSLTAQDIEAYITRREPGRDGRITADELREYYVANVQGDGLLTEEELKAQFGGYRNNQGDGPRGTPTVEGDVLYAIGGNGDVSCLKAATGQAIWNVHLVDDLGGSRPGWGYSESPLIEGDMLIVTPGGKRGTVAALDKHTGKLIWQSSDIGEGAHYSSAVGADLCGRREIVQFARESCFGLAADTGKLMWSYSGANNGTANVCTPIVADNHVFVASGYGTGGGLIKIVGDKKSQKAEEVYFEKKMAVHHGGIVKVGDFLYGFGNRGLICMNFLTGDVAWQERSVSKGSLVAADGMLYLLGEGHQVALAEANPKEYREHGQFPMEKLGRPSWAHPVVAGGRLYLRNLEKLTAYDIRARLLARREASATK